MYTNTNMDMDIVEQISCIKNDIARILKELERLTSIKRKLKYLENTYELSYGKEFETGEAIKTKSGNIIRFSGYREYTENYTKVNLKYQDEDMFFITECIKTLYKEKDILVKRLNKLEKRLERKENKRTRKHTCEYVDILDDIDILNRIISDGYINGKII